jgi:Restriction endonuclease
MRSYGLITVDEKGELALTAAAEALRDAADIERDLLFAQHIITMCEGQRFLEAIQRYELRGQAPDMEDISIELGESATSKNISTLRAWLARVGVVSAKGAYRVNDERLEEVLGKGVSAYFGLDRVDFEFVMAAGILQAQQGPKQPLDAVVVADLAESRGDDTRIRRKSLDRFVKRLEQRGLVEMMAALAGKGGSRTAFRLRPSAIRITEEQLRSLIAQSEAGFDLSALLPLREVLDGLASGTAEKIGRFGEQLAIHLCLTLGLRVRSWRKRAPHAEIDLIADRLSSLNYQRWAVQVKNTTGDLDSDQVAREIGATSGLGVTHILFVVPRAEITEPARREIRVKSRHTHLHVYKLTASMLTDRAAEPMLRHLHRQARRLEAEKRAESESRETNS